MLTTLSFSFPLSYIVISATKLATSVINCPGHVLHKKDKISYHVKIFLDKSITHIVCFELGLSNVYRNRKLYPCYHYCVIPTYIYLLPSTTYYLKLPTPYIYPLPISTYSLYLPTPYIYLLPISTYSLYLPTPYIYLLPISNYYLYLPP